jgi:hypothetical protein
MVYTVVYTMSRQEDQAADLAPEDLVGIMRASRSTTRFPLVCAAATSPTA